MPDSFVADSFVPDSPSDSFVPDETSQEKAKRMVPGVLASMAGQSIRSIPQEAAKAYGTAERGYRGMEVGAAQLGATLSPSYALERAAEATKPEYQPKGLTEKIAAPVGEILPSFGLFPAVEAVVPRIAINSLPITSKLIESGIKGGVGLGSLDAVHQMADAGLIDKKKLLWATGEGMAYGVGGQAAFTAVDALGEVLPSVVKQMRTEVNKIAYYVKKGLGVPQETGVVPLNVKLALAKGDISVADAARASQEIFNSELEKRIHPEIESTVSFLRSNPKSSPQEAISLMEDSGIPPQDAQRKASLALRHIQAIEGSKKAATEGLDAVESIQPPKIKPVETGKQSAIELPIQGPSSEAARKLLKKEEMISGPLDISQRLEQTPEEENITAIKNSIVDQERIKRGLDPIETEARKSDKITWDYAKQAIENGERNPNDLANDLLISKRPPTDEEDAMLLYHRMKLENAHRKNQEAIFKSSTEGEPNPFLITERARLEDELDLNDRASKAAGTASARSLRFRQRMVDENMSLTNMIQQLRVSAGGREITETERMTIERISKEYEKAKEELTAREAEIEKLRSGLMGKEEIEGQLKGISREKKKIETKSPEQKQAASLQRYKTYLDKKESDLMERMRTGNFSPKPRIITVLDREAQIKKAKVEKLADEFRTMKRNKELENRTLLEKGIDLFNKWRRMSVLSSVRTLGKLTSAATQRMIQQPIEEITGGILSKVPGISKIAAKAPREGGGLSVDALAKAYAEVFKKATIGDIKDIIRTGKGPLDVVYGGKSSMPPEALDFFGHIHGALKLVPSKEEFYYSLEKRASWYLKNGYDISEPSVQHALFADTYSDKMRSILMQDNALVDTYRQVLASTEKRGIGGKLIGAAIRSELPIVKIPSNFVSETMNMIGGTLKGGAQASYHLLFDKGLENLTTQEADNIMRSLKKGSIGAALLGIGYYARDKIGGYWQPGEKRKPGETKAMHVRIWNVDIPTYLLHTPAWEVVQVGATLGRVLDVYDERKQEGAIGASVFSAAKGLSEEVPLFEQPIKLAEASRNIGQFEKFAGEQARSIFEPLLLQDIAKKSDVRAGEPIARKPKTFKQELEMGIPGLRQKVPEKYSIPGVESSKDGGIESELARLQIEIKNPQRKFKGVYLNDQKFNQAIRDSGERIKSILDKRVKDTDYKQFNDEQKKRVIKNIVSMVHHTFNLRSKEGIKANKANSSSEETKRYSIIP